MSSRASGSRIARRVRSTPGQRVRALAPPVVALLLLLVALVSPGSGDSARPPGPITVTRATYACPGGDGITTAAGQVRAGTSATALTFPDREPVESLADASTWRREAVRADGVGVDQRGRASGAVGFFSAKAAKADGGGLLVGACPATVDSSWYLGLGSGGKHESTLVLANTSVSPAVADLTFWGEQGKIEAVDADGIVVDPHSVRRVDLRDLAAGEAELAVHVQRRRGSLAVAAIDRSTAVFGGTEAMTPTEAPRREQVVGGLPPGGSGRTLFLLNPTTSTARVAVRVVGPKGTITVQGLESVKVAAGRLTVVPIPDDAGAGAVALSLRSDRAVSASVRVAPGEQDRAMVEAVPALDGPAVVPIDLGTRTKAPQLALAAPGRKAVVHLEAFDASMESLAEQDVTVAAGTSTNVDLGSTKVLDAPDAAYVVVTAEGVVHGSVTYRRGQQRISSLALVAAPTTVPGPQVRVGN